MGPKVDLGVSIKTVTLSRAIERQKLLDRGLDRDRLIIFDVSRTGTPPKLKAPCTFQSDHPMRSLSSPPGFQAREDHCKRQRLHLDSSRQLSHLDLLAASMLIEHATPIHSLLARRSVPLALCRLPPVSAFLGTIVLFCAAAAGLHDPHVPDWRWLVDEARRLVVFGCLAARRHLCYRDEVAIAAVHVGEPAHLPNVSCSCGIRMSRCTSSITGKLFLGSRLCQH